MTLPFDLQLTFDVVLLGAVLDTDQVGAITLTSPEGRYPVGLSKHPVTFTTPLTPPTIAAAGSAYKYIQPEVYGTKLKKEKEYMNSYHY